jgi:ABC-type branched-subunit amino acid transport system permease subunit
MSLAAQFYLSGLLVLLFITVIAVWGLDLQYGVAGIYNFAYIMFQAAGAYAAAVLALRPAATYQAGETYVGGFDLPFPVPVLGALAAGALLALPVGLIAVRRLRGDYQALALLVLSLVAAGFVRTRRDLFNGVAGLAFIPAPLSDRLGLDRISYQWCYAGFTALVCGLVFWFMRAITSSPFGRVLRAVRDGDTAAAALGRRPDRFRMLAFVVGGALAGLSGGLLVQYLGAWAPGSWATAETFLYFTAIVVGGRGNLLGTALGTLLVPILILEGTRFLPEIGYPGLTASLAWIIVGLLFLAFLWWRPRGLLAERRRAARRFPATVRRAGR